MGRFSSHGFYTVEEAIAATITVNRQRTRYGRGVTNTGERA